MRKKVICGLGVGCISDDTQHNRVRYDTYGTIHHLLVSQQKQIQIRDRVVLASPYSRILPPKNHHRNPRLEMEIGLVRSVVILVVDMR